MKLTNWLLLTLVLLVGTGIGMYGYSQYSAGQERLAKEKAEAKLKAELEHAMWTAQWEREKAEVRADYDRAKEKHEERNRKLEEAGLPPLPPMKEWIETPK